MSNTCRIGDWRWMTGLVLALAALPLVSSQGAPASLPPTIESVTAIDITVPRSGVAETIIAKYVLNIIGSKHYSHRRPDVRLSEEWYDNCFDQLDPNHVFFLQGDLDEFKTYRSVLVSRVQRKGDLAFGFDVYQRYLERVQEWVLYSIRRGQTPFDFSRDEVVLVDRKKQPWCKTKAELEDVWRRRLKNALLTRILEEEQKRAKADETSKTDEKLKADETPKGEDQQTKAPPEGKGTNEKESQPEAPRTDPWSTAGQAEILPRILTGELLEHIECKVSVGLNGVLDGRLSGFSGQQIARPSGDVAQRRYQIDHSSNHKNAGKMFHRFSFRF